MLLFNHIRKRTWSNIDRKIQTLESFSDTEIDAGKSISKAIQYVEDPQLKTHLTKHANDEIRHGMLFRNRAEALRKVAPFSTGLSSKPDKVYQLEKEKQYLNINSHGFFISENIKNKGIINYVAMLHIAEKKAEKLFSKHCSLLKNDPETYEIFKQILKDEHYHVSYTKKFLKKWANGGDSNKVRKAYINAYTSRAINKLIRISAKFGDYMASITLFLIYFTCLIPFALFSKIQNNKTGWHKFDKNKASNSLHSQY